MSGYSGSNFSDCKCFVFISKGADNISASMMLRLEEIKALISRDQVSEDTCCITEKSWIKVIFPTKKSEESL